MNKDIIIKELRMHKEVILWKRDEKIKGLTKRYMYDADFIEEFISSKLTALETATLEKGKTETAEEIWQLLNSLEMRQPEELKTDNWRNWKYIRNTIADKYNLRKDLPVFSTNTNPVDEESKECPSECDPRTWTTCDCTNKGESKE